MVDLHIETILMKMPCWTMFYFHINTIFVAMWHLTMVDHCWFSYWDNFCYNTTFKHVWPWLTKVDHVWFYKTWLIIINHGWPWLTMIVHDCPWLTMDINPSVKISINSEAKFFLSPPYLFLFHFMYLYDFLYNISL